ncbi:metallo-beta-lactamase superfamily protein [Neobacillus bataviensis LMG 21833]|uniref:Metallo-beta-lactamase superfamily protein n=1 Tax=Neobacillus bataviensis LMG 21833 TaxID=1117379 RepID=K6C684_9BACI|nr:MBL fold metallo-hydrolase [Neobacillus bataviensis]EKN66625.1 metallo-beta-lactamase superfamily protein [Neobacillus bataviensis LMG 21833]
MFKKNNMEVYPVIVPASNKLKSFNFFLVKHKNSLTLIDAGLNTDDCWNALQKTLKKYDYTLTDLTGIYLTHHHTDHIGLVNRILSTHSIPVYAHPYAILVLKRDTEYIKMRVEFFRKLYQEMGCGENGEKHVTDLRNPIILDEDKKIHCEIQDMNDHPFWGFDLLEIPGHSPDQVAFYNKECKWLFSGDLVIENIPSNAFVEPDFNGVRTKSLVQQKLSLEKCLSLNVELIFSGHGNIIENPADLLKERIKEIDEKANKYQNTIKSGKSTASGIAQFLYKE